MKTADVLFAYQASGRIVMAYAFGYRCKDVSLEALFYSGSGAVIDFGADTFIVNAITDYLRRPELLNSILEKKYTISTDFIDRVSIILLAGFITQRIYADSNCSSVEIEINHADKEELAGIESFVSAKTQQSNHEFHENLLLQTAGMLRMKIIWNAVESIAKLLIRHPEKVSRGDIEAELRTSAFLKFCQ